MKKILASLIFLALLIATESLERTKNWNCEECVSNGYYFVKAAKDLVCLDKILVTDRIRKVYSASDCTRLNPQLIKPTAPLDTWIDWTKTPMKPGTTHLMANQTFPRNTLKPTRPPFAAVTTIPTIPPTTTLETLTLATLESNFGPLDSVLDSFWESNQTKNASESNASAFEVFPVQTSSPALDDPPTFDNSSFFDLNSTTEILQETMPDPKPIRPKFALGSIPNLEIKQGRIILEGKNTRFVIHKRPDLIVRLMKGYCRQYILVENHLEIIGNSSVNFLKALRNNPMKEFPQTCQLLSNRLRKNQENSTPVMAALNDADLLHTSSAFFLTPFTAFAISAVFKSLNY